MESAYYEDEKHDGMSSRKALGRLLPLLRAHRRWLAACFGLLALSKAVHIAGPNLIRHAIDVDIAEGNYRGLLGTVAVYVVLQALFLVTTYLFRLRMEIIGQKVMIVLRKRLFNHIVRLSVSFFDRNPPGRLMARVESDTEALRMMFTNTVVAMVGSVLLVAGMFVWMFIVAPKLTLVTLTVFPIVTVALYFYLKATTPMWLVIRKRMADVTASLTESLQGMQIIQIFDRSDDAKRKMNDVNRAKYKPQVTAELIVVVMFNFLFFVQTLVIALVLYFGARWAGATGLTIGTLVMFITYVRMFFEPVFMAAEELAVVQKAVAGAKRIFGLLDNEEIVPDPVKPVNWKGFDSEIVFENVWFSYTDDENYALRDVSFTIPRGKRFALAGVTGGGKSTVINLLFRFYDPQKGRILVDGIDLRNIRLPQLRAKFGLVLQDIFLFPGNVASNVSLSGNGGSKEKVVEACRLVSADRFVEAMPDKYESELSERGANLSRGERQLLSFARALAFDPEVLVLDEATSSVDPETERLIQDGLETLMRGRTSIIIAHRLSTIRNVDRILVIREGEIIEEGRHEELVRLGGYYSDLVKLQFTANNGLGVKES
jgi:ATP-binding cassette subfamily B multidrug efflux pump